ncbi:hypothetical protein [Bacillus sp. FJAT-22090]|uniref:hypothetical protein n=1 Tax=Bacillus sp. FJAT-22090 TaxID=1581038 RepID=UPI0011A7C38E|nr:hypothetical protein [Bacillus sp. FJAT-22090]
MVNFQSFHGTVTMISDFMIGQNGQSDGCYTLMSVANGNGDIANFVVSPTTYFVDHVMVTVGDQVTGYFDGDAPVPMIFPPQYGALVIVKDSPYQNVKIDYFNSQLESSDGQLRLNISPYTQILLTNGQAFTRNLVNRNLIVIYGPTTRSIPAQTTPSKIIVWCDYKVPSTNTIESFKV